MRDTSVMDRHCFNVDPYPDLAFHSNAHPDPEPSFHFFADPEPDPGPVTNDRNLRPLVCNPSWPSLALFFVIFNFEHLKL